MSAHRFYWHSHFNFGLRLLLVKLKMGKFTILTYFCLTLFLGRLRASTDCDKIPPIVLKKEVLKMYFIEG